MAPRSEASQPARAAVGAVRARAAAARGRDSGVAVGEVDGVPFTPRPLALAVALAVSLTVLAGCSSGPKRAQPAEPPTLAALAKREIKVQPDDGVKVDQEAAAKAYRDFLAAAPRDPHRQEALRRLGDLEMDRIDTQQAGDADPQPAAGPTPPTATAAAAAAVDYAPAIARYNEYLKIYPNATGNDRVLYQLARAYELSGDLEKSLATLNRLVSEYPATAYMEEAHFRRGELMFTLRDYEPAEQAYQLSVNAGLLSPYYERSLYMRGWSQFKQGRHDEALGSFFGVLDRKLQSARAEPDLDKLSWMTRADRELVDDTFRVTSLSLENLQGAATIAGYINSEVRRDYEFRVFQNLGELYLKQERVKDAADTFASFAQRRRLHPQAAVLQSRVIDIYAANGFSEQALSAKKAYVDNYGVASDFQRANPDGWKVSEPLVKAHLAELAQHYHALAQKGKKPEDYKQAAQWYRKYIASFPTDVDAAKNSFLLSELLYEDRQFGDAAAQYEQTAYAYPRHERSADAGYAALLAFAAQEKALAGDDAAAARRAGIDSALKFARTFGNDARVGAVLVDASDRLYKLRDNDRAAAIARQVIVLDPPAGANERRIAWTVLAHVAFERNAFADAEHAYGEVLALTPPDKAQEKARADLTERLAASVYKRGEQARSDGKLQDAVAHFNRVAALAPASAIRATAHFDAAAALLALKDWDGAARALEDFRGRYPKHPLQDDVTGKLAVAYVETGRWSQAAGEFEKMSAANKDPALARAGLWQAAEMYDKAGARTQAVRVYERYVKQYPEPLEPALEARYRLAQAARADGNAARELALMREVQKADASAGRARTDRTRYLGGMATLTLVQPLVEDYRKVTLVEPLAQRLKQKKAKMETALKAYAAASDYGIAEVVTAATFQTAELYRDFGKAMLNSQRPKGLKKDELEQYNVLLEEQAFPFEEKAIELHETNAKRAAGGLYDKWVRDSFGALALLRPVRYGKVERAEVAVDAIR